MKLILPLSVVLPRKKKEDKVWILNLGTYRNTHYHVLNQAKELYKQLVGCAFLMATKVGEWPPQKAVGPFLFTYTIFPGSKRTFDLGNPLPIIQKFTDDALVEMFIIKNDNYKIISAVNYRFGGFDKMNPRCELLIDPWAG